MTTQEESAVFRHLRDAVYDCWQDQNALANRPGPNRAFHQRRATHYLRVLSWLRRRYSL